MKRFTKVLVLALVAMALAAPLFANGGTEKKAAEARLSVLPCPPSRPSAGFRTADT